MYAPQALFCRFTVFAGGATLEAVGALNGDTPEDHGDSDALEGLAALLDRMEEAAGEPRYRMLETIRDYAGSLLTASSEQDAAEAAECELRGARQAEWMGWLEAEVDNLRATLRWASESRETERGLRLAGLLWYFWYWRRV